MSAMAAASSPPAKKQRVAAAAPSSSAPSTPSSSAKQVPRAKFCLNCQKELARNIRITCVECAARRPPVELCVECFAVGVELGAHKKSHRYSVSDCLAFPVVREPRDAAAATTMTPQKDSGAAAATSAAAAAAASGDWTADEELLLLEGIEMFGMGNWKDIAEHVATKSEKKCEAHYMGAYLSTSDLLPRFLDDPEPPVTEDSKTSAAHTSPLKSASANANGVAVASPPLSTAAPPAKNPGSELAGYMPLRGDFDVEYDNEAELILADMEFAEDDHPTERELKLKVIAIYNAKLDERERRKRFVVERGLLDYKRHQQIERRRPKDERELVAQMRPFARYQTPAEHDDFITGLITAMRLRKQILLLQEYRKNGVRTLAEAELYDAEKKKRETEQALQKQRDSAAYLYESGRPASSSRDRANRWLNRDQVGDTPGDKSGRDIQEHARTRGSGASGVTGSTAGDGAAGSSSFLVDGAPGCHLLTPQEKELCSKLKLLPKHYLVIKDALIRECFRLGYLTRKNAKEMVKIDVNKTGQIYDFFVKCGWVKTESTAPKVTSTPKSKSAAGVAPTAAPGATGAEDAASGAQASTPLKRKAQEADAGGELSAAS